MFASSLPDIERLYLHRRRRIEPYNVYLSDSKPIHPYSTNICMGFRLITGERLRVLELWFN